MLQKELNESASLRWERIFTAALNGLLSSGNTSNWEIGGKRIHNAAGYVDLAKRFADKAVLEIDFK